MTMVVRNQQRIFYRFEGEKGAYLLLHHGLFGSHADWYDAGYVDALRDDFRLIVMDARGHGRSDHPLAPERYRLAELADDVVAIMDELEIRNLHFCGYSLGALVGFELLMRHPERVRIVMLAGETPFLSEAMQADWRQLAERVRTEGLATVRDRLAAEQGLVARTPLPEQEGDQPAALALLEALAQEAPRPDEGRISVDSPVALFVGEADPALERVRDARRRIHRARFVSFPGQTHAGLFDEREALVGEMLRLLRPGRRGEDGEGRERGARASRGRGRGARETEPEAAPLPSAPLIPPPPVDVPSQAEPERDPAQEAASPAAAPDAPAEPGPAPATAGEAPAPSPAASRAAPQPPGPDEDDGDDEGPRAAGRADDEDRDNAPDDIPVRARWQEATPPPEEPDDPWERAEELAPPVPGRAVLQAEEDEGDEEMEEDEDDDWPGAPGAGRY